MKALRAAALSFSAQLATMLAVMVNVHLTVQDRPLAVMAVQGVIGLAWVVNVNAVAKGTALTRAAYIAGGMLGAGLGTILGGAR